MTETNDVVVWECLTPYCKTDVFRSTTFLASQVSSRPCPECDRRSRVRSTRGVNVFDPSWEGALPNMSFVRCPDYTQGLLHDAHEHEAFDVHGVAIAKGKCVGLTVGVNHVRYVTGGDPICKEPLIETPQYHIHIEFDESTMCYKCANLVHKWLTPAKREGDEG